MHLVLDNGSQIITDDTDPGHWSVNTPSFLALAMRDFLTAREARTERAARGFDSRREERRATKIQATRARALKALGIDLVKLREEVKALGFEKIDDEVRKIVLTLAYRGCKKGRITAREARLFGARVRESSR